MKVILGVDIGGSTTKIVAFEEKQRVLDCLQVRAVDQITSLYGAIGHILYKCHLTLRDVEAFVLTGVGATMVKGDIYGIHTYRVKEFEAIGRGALELTGLKETLVVSVGTGTAFVMASEKECRHIGGSGVGGGTLTGLASRLLGETHIDAIVAAAEKGSLRQVDLAICDISNEEIPSLPPHVTAANFGKVESTATKEDFALGLLNMVFETVGSLAAFACKNTEIREIVVTGSVAALPMAQKYLDGVGMLHNVRFIIPEQAIFATAIGAALQYFNLEDRI
jgi:type II pantothenate kinase